MTTKHASAPVTDTASLAEAVLQDTPTPSTVSEPAIDEAEAGSLSPVAQAAATAADELRRQMDALSLTQALLDFEMANARVLDLTARLVEANGRVLGLQAEADAARRTIDEVRALLSAKDAELADLKASRSYKLAERIQTLLRVLRG